MSETERPWWEGPMGAVCGAVIAVGLAVTLILNPTAGCSVSVDSPTTTTTTVQR